MTSPVRQVPVVDDATKLRFAAALLRLNNGNSAANEVLGDRGIGERMWLATILPVDAVVVAEMDRLKDEQGEMAFLPSKAALVRQILARAENTQDNSEYVELMKLAANMMGFVEKPGAGMNVGNLIQNNVMYVKDLGTDQEWENKAREQQRLLTLNATN